MRRLIVSVMLLLVAIPAFAAAPLRVYVGEFNAVGVAAKDDTRIVLQSLLASRLSSDKLLAVATAAEADLIVSGTYISIGKQYNIDAVAKTAAGQTVTRTFVQGEGGQEALFSAIPKLAEKLSADLTRQLAAGNIATIATAPATAFAATRSVSPDILRADSAAPAVGDLQRASQGNIIRPQAFYRGVPNKGEIKRLEGIFNILALGETDVNGKRLLFMAQDRAVQLIREGENRPITGFSLGVDEKILALDYVDADQSGSPELYVTIVRGGDVASQIWELKRNKLVKVAENIPYFFRAISLAGDPLKLYAQEQGRKENRYYGDVYEVSRKGNKIIRKLKLSMPRYGNLYSFNQFKHTNGELLTVVYHEENYLVIYDKDQKELWRSNDAFGGSELFYKVEDDAMINPTTDKYRWFFMNQRILVTSKQEILVGKNEGFFVLGYARMYKRGAVYSLYWNGAALEEVWRTKDTQNYMPDFVFDEKKSELLLLQLIQREDIIMHSKGASALQIKKVE